MDEKTLRVNYQLLSARFSPALSNAPRDRVTTHLPSPTAIISEFPSTHRSREGRHRSNHTRGWVPTPAPAPITWNLRAGAHHAYSTSRPGGRCVESIRGSGRECPWPATTRIVLDSTNAMLGLPKLGVADGGMYCGYDCAHLGEFLIMARQFRGHYVLSDQVCLRLWESSRTRSRLLRHV